MQGILCPESYSVNVLKYSPVNPHLCTKAKFIKSDTFPKSLPDLTKLINGSMHASARLSY